MIKFGQHGKPVFDTSHGFALQHLSNGRFAYVNHVAKVCLPSWPSAEQAIFYKDSSLATQESIEKCRKTFDSLFDIR